MRWFIAVLLLLVVAAGVAVLVFDRPVRQAVGLPAPAETSAAAGVEIDPAKVTKITLARGSEKLTLTKEGGRWTQPGDWPVREKEVGELLAAVCSLKTRYLPVPADDPKALGLDESQKPHSVTLSAGADTTLLFGTSADGTAYVRVAGQPNALRIAPDVLAVVSRPFEDYRRRQLFPEPARVKLNLEGAVLLDAVPPDGVTDVRVSGPDGTFALHRLRPNPAPRRDPNLPTAPPAVFLTQLAEAWEVSTPAGRDRPEPLKLRAALSAIPDLWVDGFARPDPLADALAGYLASPALLIDSAEVLKIGRPAWEKDLAVQLSGLSKERVAELTPPHAAAGGGLAGVLVAEQYPKEREVTVTTGGKSVTLRVGGLAKVEAAGEPPQFGEPPPEETRYHYAKLENNPQTFLVRADRLNELFAKPDDLRDPLVARFTPDEAQTVTVSIPRTAELAALGGGLVPVAGPVPPLVVTLTKKKGDPFAEREDDRKDRWKVGDRLAQADKVTELLDALSKMEAKTPAERLAEVPAAFDKFDGPTVTVTAQAKVVEGDTPPPARTFAISFTARDPKGKKLAASVAGLPRVNLIDDAVLSLAAQDAPAYRSRRQFDTAEVRLDQFRVTKPDGSSYAVVNSPRRGETRWRLTAPLTVDPDKAKATRLVGDLSGLEAVEYVDETAKADKLAEYGLADAGLVSGVGGLVGGGPGLTPPRYAVDLTFTGTGAKADKLLIGNERADKGDCYARLQSGGGVFTVSKALVDSLDKGPLNLLPDQLWASAGNGLVSVTVRRGTEAYTLTRDDKKWAVSGPFDAPASADDARQLAEALAGPKAEKYDALTPDPFKHGLSPDLAPLLAPAGGLAWNLAPTMTLTVRVWTKSDDGPEEVVTRTLLIGNQAEAAAPPPPAPGQPPPPTPQPGRFARFADGPNTAVFVLPASVVTAADRPALKWLDRDLLALSTEKLATISVGGPDPVTLTYNPTRKEWAADGFAVDKPLVTDLVTAASNPAVMRIDASGPNVNWASYGLEPGLAALVGSTAAPLDVSIKTAGTNPRTHTLRIGRELRDDERGQELIGRAWYARVDDGPAVAVVSGATAAALRQGKLGLADRSLLAFKPDDVISLVRTMPGEEFELASGIGWDAVKPTRFKADKATVDTALTDLAAARAVRVENVSPTGEQLKEYGLDATAAELTLLSGTDKPQSLVLKVGKPADPAKPAGDRFVRVGSGGPVKVLAGDVAARLLADPVKFKNKQLGDKVVDADKIVITRDGRKAVFGKESGTWKVLEPVVADAETADLDALFTAAAVLRADELVAEKPADLKQYGLDPPAATVQFFNGDKGVRTVLVGKKDADGKRVFGKLAGTDTVALFDPAVSARLLGEYRRRAVWEVKADQVQSVAVSSEKANFAFTKAGNTWADPKAPDDPPDAAAVAELVAAVGGLKAERYAADKDADPKAFGLDKPTRVIAVTVAGGAKTLHLGGPVPGTDGKQVYAKVADKDRTEVFVLSEKDTAALTRDRAGYKK